MSAADLRINNTIFLMHLVSGAYARAHHLTRSEFSRFDDQYHVLRYVSQCPDVFDSLPEEEIVKEVYDSELFKLLSDARTRLFLLTNKELGVFLDAEVERGASALHDLLA